MARPLLILCLLAVPSLALAEGGRRVAVVPFAALSGDVPPRVGAKAAGMFSTELKNAEGLELVSPPAPKGNEAAKEALVKARKLVTDAQALREAKKFHKAQEVLTQAVAAFATAGGQVEDAGEVADAWALLAVSQYAGGQDDRAEASLRQSLALAPNRPLPLAATSPLFSRTVDQVRKSLLGMGKGTLAVDSVPAGLPVVVDGVQYGTTPLTLKDVPPGRHLWRVRLPTGEFAGGEAEVAPGKQVKVVGELPVVDTESRIVAALTQNKLDTVVVNAAKEHAAAQKAEAVFLGAISREGKSLALDAFLFNARSGELRRLPRTTFDEDLLSAGQQFLTMVGEYAKAGTLGEATKVPTSVASGRVSSARPTEAAYSLSAAPGRAAGLAVEEPEAGKETKPTEEARQPLKRTPLKRK